MALLTNIKINGIPVQNAYISIIKKRDQKIYEQHPDGTYLAKNITWAHIGGAINQDAWISGDRFNLNHVVPLDGELTKDKVYPLLKTMKFPEFDLDLTTAIDV